MFLSSRSRLMLAALIFALGWASGAAVHRLGLGFLAAVCFTIGSVGLSYLVWEYHRAWRLRPLSTDPKGPLRLRNWPGVSLNGLTVRPEYITAGATLLFCVLGMYRYFQVSPQSSVSLLQSPPAVMLPEARPLQ
jgi:hypothetical protein